MVSPLSFARHGLRSGDSCLAATSSPKKNISATLAGRGSYRGLLTWKGTVQAPFDGTKAFLERIYDENLHWFGATLNAKRSRVSPQRLEVPEVRRSTTRSSPAVSESARPKLMQMPPQLVLKPQPPQALRKQTPHPVPHHFLCQIRQPQKEEQDHSWSLRQQPLHQRQQVSQHRRLQAPVARMPPGVGIATTTVHVVSGVFGMDHGITEMRPAAAGSIMTAGIDDPFVS